MSPWRTGAFRILDNLYLIVILSLSQSIRERGLEEVRFMATVLFVPPITGSVFGSFFGFKVAVSKFAKP